VKFIHKWRWPETRVGLSYDLNEKVAVDHTSTEDALEEYDSAETIDLIGNALKTGGDLVKLSGGNEFLSSILLEHVDIVVNIVEGRGTNRSREAQVPAVLEMLNIAYSASDPECLAICLDKPLTKQLLSDAGIRTPFWQVVRTHAGLEQIP
jgi:D-alanine-D-alanine ligase